MKTNEQQKQHLIEKDRDRRVESWQKESVKEDVKKRKFGLNSGLSYSTPQ